MKADALALAARGLYVFPCEPRDKLPKVIGKNPDGSPRHLAWSKYSTTDPTQIEKWWTRWQDANIGIDCGKSGLFVVDIDGKAGWDASIELERVFGPLPDTWATLTGEGEHWIFKQPQGVRLGNSAGELAAGIDTRGYGGLIIAPPSIHPNGNTYKWMGNHAPDDTDLAEVPTWLVDLLTKEHAPGEKWLKGALSQAVIGTRNDIGYWLSCQLRDNRIPVYEAESIMRRYADGVPQRSDAIYSESEALATMKSAYTGAPREPARNPDKPVSPAIKNDNPQEPQPPQDEHSVTRPRIVVRNAAYAMQPQPPISWVIEPLFSAGSVSLIVGDPGSKKTYSMIDAGICVVLDKFWIGFTTRRVPVLFVDEESGDSRMARRVSEVLRGEFGDEKAAFEWASLARFNLGSSEDAALLHALIEERKAGLVIVDALADVMPGGDENAVKDVHPVLMRLRTIADQTQAAIAVIHHANRAGDYRGSSAIAGAVDCLVMVESKQGDGLVRFTVKKHRDSEPITFAGRIHFDAGQVWMEAAEGYKDGKPMGRAQAYVMRYLAEHGPSPLTDIQAHADSCSENGARQAVYALVELGYLQRVDNGGPGTRAVYGLTAKGVG